MEEEKIIVDLSPGTTIQEETTQTPPETPPETKQKKTKTRIAKVRLESEPNVKMEGSPSQEQIKPKRAPPKRKPQEIKEEEQPKEPEQPKEDIKIVKLVKCDKCNKSLTAKSLKYSHKCGNENQIVKQPSKKINETLTKISPSEISRTETKSTFPIYELNPKVQRLKEKQEKISRLIVNAF